MEKKRTVLILATATCLLLSVGCQRPVGLSEADRAAIRQADETFARLVNAKDYKALAAMYAEDAVWMPPNRPAVQGRAGIQAAMESGPPISNFRLQLLEVEGRGDLAYTREIISGESPLAFREKVMAIWGKQPDGSWKVLRDIWNSDLPLPAPEQPSAAGKKTR